MTEAIRVLHSLCPLDGDWEGGEREKQSGLRHVVESSPCMHEHSNGFEFVYCQVKSVTRLLLEFDRRIPLSASQMISYLIAYQDIKVPPSPAPVDSVGEPI